MDGLNSGDVVLFSAVVLLASNHVVVRIPGWDRFRLPFWILQACNLAAAIWLMVVGIPGVEGNLRVFNWVIGLLLVFRIIVNNNRLVNAIRQRREDAQDADKREAIRAAIRAAREADGEGEE